MPAAPPAIDFSELQLKNFNHQYNMFVQETGKGGEVLNQAQHHASYVDPQGR
jgi:hypothetical protein